MPIAAWLVVGLAVFLIGVTKSGFGSGAGLMIVPMTTIALRNVPGYGAEAALPLLLPLLIVGDVIATWQYRRHFSTAIILRLAPGTVVGIVVGTLVLKWFASQARLAEALINLEIGFESVFLVALNGYREWRARHGVPPYRPSPVKSAAVGTFAGVSSTLAHAAGPIVALHLLPQRLERRVFVGTCALYFFLVNTAKLPGYWEAGLFAQVSPLFALQFVPLVLLGAVFGFWVNRRLNDALFIKWVYAITFALGWYILFRGVDGLVRRHETARVGLVVGDSMPWTWRDKKTSCAGSVLFRGRIAPRPAEFHHLARRGFTLTHQQPSRAAHWHLRLAHPKWGDADVICLRDCPRPPRQMVDFDPMLTREERDLAYLGESTVSVLMEGQRADVLRDRKCLLAFLRAVMADDGVVAIDHTAQRFWPREALDDELAHDADLDIESLYTLHAVTDEDEGQNDSEDLNRVVWLHSHGLAEIGLFDFDVLNPSDDLLGRGRDTLRAIAFAILEGKVRPNTPRFSLMNPGGDVAFVDVARFARRAGQWNALRAASDDPDHNKDRAVLCEPAAGLFSRLFGRVAPSTLLAQPAPDDLTIPFSDAASDLMAQRARGTYLQFRQLAGEFAEFDFPVLAKLAYRVDGGQPDDREHLWFSVNEFGDDRVDATLENAPLGIERFKKGHRAWHKVDRLTDWGILSPLGMITPRYAVPARQIRANRDQFRQLLRDARRLSEAG